MPIRNRVNEIANAICVDCGHVAKSQVVPEWREGIQKALWLAKLEPVVWIQKRQIYFTKYIHSQNTLYGSLKRCIYRRYLKLQKAFVWQNSPGKNNTKHGFRPFWLMFMNTALCIHSPGLHPTSHTMVTYTHTYHITSWEPPCLLERYNCGNACQKLTYI